MKKVLILGGGISALSAAWYLLKDNPKLSITLLEKEDRLGGAIQTGEKEGVLFEMGPRTFPLDRSCHLLELISELELEKELIYSSPEAKSRYLLRKGKLRTFPREILPSLFTLLKEPFIPASSEEETVFDFAKRRFGKRMAHIFFDPLCLGIFGKEAKSLSVNTCFPFLKRQEQKGSLLFSFLKSKLFRKKTGTLFTLKRGMGSLIGAIEKKLAIDIHYNTPIEKISQGEVFTPGKRFTADCIVSALPLAVLGEITGKWKRAPVTSFWVVGLIGKEIPKKRGYGYLSLPEEKEPVFGMVFDSHIFPQKNSYHLLTAMVRLEGDKSWAEEQASRAASLYLKIPPPKPLFSYLTKETIPYFPLGFDRQKEAFLQQVRKENPNIFFTGNYLEGPSVEVVVSLAKRTAQKICTN